MALITCKECGKEVSDKAAACPHCGMPMVSRPVSSDPSVLPVPPQTIHVERERRNFGCGTLIAVAFLAVIVMFVWGSFKSGYSDYAARSNATRATPTPTARAVPWAVVGRQGQGTTFIVIDAASGDDKAVYRAAAMAECPPDWCQAMFWAQGTAAASVLPMSTAQARAQTALYRRNTATGLSQFTWRCDAFPGTSDAECFTPD